LAILCLPGFVVLFLCWLIKEYKDKREKKRVSKKERKNNKNEKIKNIIFNI
jgi:hypothetical protein